MKILILFVAISVLSGCSNSQSSCNLTPYPNSSLDATNALQECLYETPQGQTLTLPPGNYNISHTLILPTNITLSGYDATLTAVAYMGANGMISANYVDNLVISGLTINGNKNVLRPYIDESQASTEQAPNGVVTNCTHCQFLDFTSENALSGSGLEFAGDYVLFDRVFFHDNGFDIAHTRNEWSDGLTLLRSNYGVVQNSVFQDNSDVDLIVGVSRGVVIQNNTIIHTNSYSFAGLMAFRFAPTSLGDFQGAVFRNNVVTCNENCGVGLMIGNWFWYTNIPAIQYGEFYGNTITGSRFGLLVDGATGYSIHDNMVNTHIYTNGICTTAPLLYASFSDIINTEDCGPEPLFNFTEEQ